MRIKLKTDFSLETTMDSGQVFGFEKNGAVYSGEIGGRSLAFFQKGDELHFRSDGPAPQARLIEDYFDLKRDLAPVYGVLKSEEKLRPVVAPLGGLRLIRQDAWQGLACFILSSNNNVKRIQHIWKNMTRHYASRRRDSKPGFPDAREIAEGGEKILRALGLGYRAPFLWASAQYVAHNPDCLRHIREADYAGARERVIAFPGIGPKVADCVLLYAFQKYEAFPVDVWILRAMRKLYFNKRKVSEKRVHEFGRKRWKEHAGYVQQYIFHGIRTGIL